MNLEIRKCDDGDRAERARLFNEMWPGFYETEEAIRLEDESWPDSAPFERWMGIRNGQAVGCLGWVHPFWMDVEGILSVSVMMDADDDDFIPAWEWTEAKAMERNPRGFRSWGRDDFPSRIAKLESLGYRKMEESYYFQLDPKTFDATPFEAEKARLESEGLRFVTCAELEAEGYDWKRPLYEAATEMVLDIPSGEAMAMESYDDYLKGLDPWNFYPPMMYLVMDGETIAAYSRLTRLHGKPQAAWTSFGGSRRAYRRRGLMTALKAWSIAKARDEFGMEEISTDNLAHNPMRGINERLGFKKWFTAFKMGKDFGEPAN